MLKLPNFSKATLLAAFFLLLTGCNNKTETDTETNLTISKQSSQSTSDQVTLTQEDSRELKSSTPAMDKTIPNKDENNTVTENTRTAKENTPSTINVKSGTTPSNTVNSDTPWVVNGHTLPPEPDKSVNDSTLLGVDVNDNGVRDDVERWIYETYKDKHPIHIDIAMQAARAYKKVLEMPEKAKEIEKTVGAPVYCEGYYSVYADKFGDKIYIYNRIVNNEFEKQYFNSDERKKQNIIYQKILSGGSYTVPWPSEGKKYCDFNTSKYEK